MKRIPELLAPVGSREALVAAVENGADAVYMGCELFSARAYAANFSEEELGDAIDFAHIRGVRAYVTVNTLIKDSEFKDAFVLLRRMCQMGADAVIIQDIGLLKEALRAYPALPVHASTQMAVHNTPSAEMLAEMGVKRVVLSREMSLGEISQIKQSCGIEIEVFIHGALCICYSGQCLMSSMIGGRSGNRGYCAQPCRRRYKMTKNGQEIKTNGDYLLSPKDLCAARLIPGLVEAGVDSFKIEGRMKRPEYVAGVVRIYRALIDRYMASPKSYHVSDTEMEALLQLFNRGFTSAYLENKKQDMMSRGYPANRGLEVGKVTGYNRNDGRLMIKLQRSLRQGDGIGIGESGIQVKAFFRDGKRIKEAQSGDIVEILSPGVKKGERVYRTSDSLQLDLLQKTCTSSSPLRKVPVDIRVRIETGKPIELRMSALDSFSVSVSSAFDVEKAKSHPLTPEKIKEQLSKLGNTVFKVRTMEVEVKGAVFIPLKELNNLRTEAAGKLEVKRAAYYHRECKFPALPVFLERKGKSLPALTVAVSSLQGLYQAVRGGADAVYLDACLSASEFKDTVSACKQHHSGLYLFTPRITKDSEMNNVMKILEMAAGCDGVVVSNTGILNLAHQKGIPAIADFPLNIFNCYSASLLNETGAGLLTVSPELTLREIREITQSFEAEAIIESRLELMVSEYCLLTELPGCGSHFERADQSALYEFTDEKGFSFPVFADRQGRTHVLNSRKLSMLDRLQDLIEAGLSSIRIDARRDEDNLERITAAYRQALDSEMTVQRQGKNYTHGHYYRGVL